MNKKRLSVNMVAGLFAFAVNSLIGFFLSPYIIENLGSESYAYVKLSNDCLTYVSLLSIALNSMSTRFISVSYMSGDKQQANQFFSSVFYANIILTGAILLLMALPIVFINKIINIPTALVSDVRTVFIFVLINFSLSTVFSVYSVSIFIKNKLYLSSLRSIESGTIRAIVLTSLFTMFMPKIYFIPFTGLITTIYVALFNIYYSKKLLPDMKVRKKDFDFKKIRSLISSGIWNAISQLSYILNEGLDLLVSNLLIGPTAMGMLAIAKTVPAMIMSGLGSVSGTFSPDMTQMYAENRTDEIKKAINSSIKILGIIVNVPIAGLVIYGADFYSLWVPSQNSSVLQILSILTIAALVISGSTAAIYNVFTITNKVKTNSLVCLSVGLLNTIIVLTLVKTTNLGVYAVAGVSTTTATVRILAFTLPYGAKCIGEKWNAFFGPTFKSIFCCVVVCAVCYLVKHLIPVNGWLTFFASCMVSGILGLIINCAIVLKKEDYKKIMKKFTKKR